ncbi:MAG: hypothetical protein IT431_16685 [Phycisphaerales bacterium]|nr:hypothetical protein [Phycisphaerales bacterium]
MSGLNAKESGIILLSIRNQEDQLDSERIEQILHSELSSILVWQNLDKFPAELWASANPEGFEYSGQESLDFAGERAVATVEELKNGFLGKYAQIDPTQDMNRVAEQLMMENPRYAAAIRVYPRLRRKALAYAIFLTRVDPPLGHRAMAFVRAATGK